MSLWGNDYHLNCFLSSEEILGLGCALAAVLPLQSSDVFLGKSAHFKL